MENKIKKNKLGWIVLLTNGNLASMDKAFEIQHQQ
jgi:hypothetical protein